LFSIIGIIASSMLFFGSELIADNIIKMHNAKYVLMALAPSIFFVCVSSVIRGYFVGMQNMQATSRSQILEQIFKCVFTIGIVYFMSIHTFFPNDKDLNAAMMAAGANFAATISAVLSTIYIIVFYLKRRKGIYEKINSSTVESKSTPLLKMFRRILLISIPISLSSIIAAINRIIDTATITRGIEVAFASVIPAHSSIAAIFNPTMEQLTEEAVRLAGVLAKSDTLINLPTSLNLSFATVLVPSISAALARGEKKEASRFVSYSLLISLLIIMPCAVGYIALGQPIYQILYPNVPDGYQLLQLSALSLVFIALNQTISGSLQGIGKIYVPATGLLLGCIAKFILNTILIRQPSINIYGAPIGSIVCQIISFAYCFTMLSKNVSIRLSLKKYVLKPLGCSVVMGISAYFAHKAILYITGVNIIALIISIIIAVMVYAFMILLTNSLSKDEMEMLPMGAKLYSMLKKFRLIK
jgi:stage V sporulation protein B